MPEFRSAELAGQAQGINQNLAQIASILRTAFPMSAVQGTFTLAAAATTTVNDVNVKSTSIIVWTPTNNNAATVEGSAQKLYLSSRVSGTSFSVSTANGLAPPAATQTFQYLIVNVG